MSVMRQNKPFFLTWKNKTIYLFLENRIFTLNASNKKGENTELFIDECIFLFVPQTIVTLVWGSAGTRMQVSRVQDYQHLNTATQQLWGMYALSPILWRSTPQEVSLQKAVLPASLMAPDWSSCLFKPRWSSRKCPCNMVVSHCQLWWWIWLLVPDSNFYLQCCFWSLTASSDGPCPGRDIWLL